MKVCITLVLICCAIFLSCGGNQQQSKAAAVTQAEIEKFDDGDVKHGRISAKCKENLTEFEKLLAEYGALVQREKEGNPVDEATKLRLEERTKTKMMELSKDNLIFADPDCAVAFSNAQRRFGSYVMGVILEE